MSQAGSPETRTAQGDDRPTPGELFLGLCNKSTSQDSTGSMTLPNNVSVSGNTAKAKAVLSTAATEAIVTGGDVSGNNAKTSIYIGNASINLSYDQNTTLSNVNNIANTGALRNTPALGIAQETSESIEISSTRSLTDTQEYTEKNSLLTTSTMTSETLCTESLLEPEKSRSFVAMEHHAKNFQDMGENVKVAYKELLDSFKNLRSWPQTPERRQDIKKMAKLFNLSIHNLVQYLLASPIKKPRNEKSVSIAFNDANAAINLLLEKLKEPIPYFKLTSKAEAAQALSPDWYKDWSINVNTYITDFNLALEIFYSEDRQRPNCQSMHEDTEMALRKLSTDGIASSRLKECLCQTCPRQCHEFHTAYFSLEPDNQDANSIADLDKSDMIQIGIEEQASRWQCAVAFKSTVTGKTSLIWLKVVSTVTFDVSPQSAETASPVVESNSAARSHSYSHSDSVRPQFGANKRRASSPLRLPENKFQKTRLNQSIHSEKKHDLDSIGRIVTPSGVEVCPEYLIQHHTTQYAIMRMVDSSGSDHRIFYLPEEKRPSQSGPSEYRTLKKILDKHQCTELDTAKILWLSRVVAEAVLRFDLYDNDLDLEETIVLHNLPNRGLVPFMEVRIEKMEPDGTVEDDLQDELSTGRSEVLLSLGLILLKLGLPTNEALPVHAMDRGPRARQKYIISNASKAKLVGRKFSDVIRKCASFVDVEDEDEDFKKRFYREIVQPLKEIEHNLLRDTQAGNRYTGTDI